MKNLIKLFTVAFIITLASCGQDDDIFIPVDPGVTEIDNAQTVDIVDPVTGVIQGESVLRRKNGYLTVSFKATDLTPNYAYTLWWVIWNNPEKCKTPNACEEIDFLTPDQSKVEVIYATGQVVGPRSFANFNAQLKENDVTGSINAIFGMPRYGGMKNASSAEVHLVLRSHGPAIRGQVDEQTGTYNGGCKYDLGAFTGDIPDSFGECGDILAAVHQPK